MPLAMLTGRGDQTLVDALQLTPLPDKQILFSDGRDLDPGERTLLENADLFWTSDPADLTARPLPAGPLWVHFDADILRLEDAPAMSYPAAGGPALDTLHALFTRLAASGRVVAVSVSCWNPTLPGADRSQENTMALVDVLLGRG
jgi:arginase